MIVNRRFRESLAKVLSPEQMKAFDRDQEAERQKLDKVFGHLNCSATTKSGRRCRRKPVAHGLCATHLQADPELRRPTEGMVQRIMRQARDAGDDADIDAIVAGELPASPDLAALLAMEVRRRLECSLPERPLPGRSVFAAYRAEVEP